MVHPVTENELKQAFWHSVILTGDTRRMVARSAMGGDSTGPPSPMIIFVPQSWDDDFDLVLSLCADGTQRVTVDLDTALDTTPHNALGTYRVGTVGLGVPAMAHIATPSTNNWHVWGTAEVEWPEVVAAFSNVNNPGYMAMNQRKGYCGLRPPWKNKHDYYFNEMMGARFNRRPDRDMFAGIDWSKVTKEEEFKQELPSLEDLFAQEGI